MLKVRAHTCYLGKTGYAAHARSFFRELSNHVDLRVRNYTWDDNLNYLNDTDYRIIDTITLNNGGNDLDYNIIHGLPNHPWVNSKDDEFKQDIDIVLMDMNHYYFYEEYSAKVKIAYTVWESTELPEEFFNQLLKFDYLWVVTKWHKEVAIKQGYPEHRIFIVHEGVDDSLYFRQANRKVRDHFEFMFFGRWDYRKSVPEIVKAFLEAFPNNDEVCLILSADNPYSIDGLNSTEERLSHYGLLDDRIKVKHFLSREEYDDYLKNGHVLITCARSEGWNIPLIEAMVAGTPVIYSNWGAQLEFASGKGNPVKIIDERLASIGANLGFAGYTPGLYSEPDFDNLKEVMIDCFENWGDKKKLAREEADLIFQEFNWAKIGLEGFEQLKKVCPLTLEVTRKEEAAIIMSHADTPEKLSLLRRSVNTLKNQGLLVIISSHIQVPEEFYTLADYIVFDRDNPVVYPEEYNKLSNTIPIHYIRYADFDLSYSYEFNHGFAAMKLIKSGLSIAKANNCSTAHFINYDYIIDDPKLLEAHNTNLTDYDMIAYSWNGEGSINSAFFSANVSMLNSVLTPFITKESYFAYNGKVILEDVLYAACYEYGLDIQINNIESIQKLNTINGVILSTYPQLTTESGGEGFVYLAQNQDGENYLCLVGAESESIFSFIEYQDKSIEYQLAPREIVAYRIPNYLLDEGFSVDFPNLKIKKEYNNLTKKATCMISNPNYIKDLLLEPRRVTINYNINFINGAFVEITGQSDSQFLIELIDNKSNEILYSNTININCWVRSTIKYFVDWKVKITNLDTKEVYEEDIDLAGKRVLISLESSALGDSLAWFPQVAEFKKKHNCEVIISTFKNELFIENYPELKFVSPGEIVHDLYAQYKIGWFYNGDNSVNTEYHQNDFKKLPLQSTACDILGITHTTIKPKLTIPLGDSPVDGKYVCIAMHSTAQAKYWNNPNGWQELTNYFIDRGLKVIIIGLEEDGYMQNYYPNGATMKQGPSTLANVILHLKHSEMFVGVGSGLSWLSWAVGTPTVLISGFSLPSTEIFDNNVIRIFKGGGCTGCFNRHRLDAGDWNWCPDQKGTHRQFECTRNIIAYDVIKEIERYEALGHSEKSTEVIVQESYDLGMVQNHKEILEAAEFFKSLDVTNFMEIGTDQGGSFAIWSKLSNDGIRISVDMPHGQFGRSDYDEYERDEYLKSLGSNVTMLWGSSHDYTMLEEVESVLSGELLDFLFIDGDHTYDGVKQDYEMYRHLVKPGGWIGFHDTKDTEFHRNANCRVDQLWSELKGIKMDFIDYRSEFGGIGFIQVEG
jgi:autotransporter strand-loop-strand O-heptosyltransferase